MKFVSNFLEMGEYASIAGSALLYDAVTSPEQRNVYLAQVDAKFGTRTNLVTSRNI